MNIPRGSSAAIATYEREDTDYFIRDYPWAAIAITPAVIGAAGVLIGLGATPRRRI
jgi:ElaB/YqjD/DUF883 family membrane-anchored ribosome-binding protein